MAKPTTQNQVASSKSSTRNAASALKVRDTTARMKAEYLPLNKAVKAIQVSLEHEGKCVWNADLRAELDWAGFSKFSLKCCTFMGEGTDVLVIGMSDYNPSADDGFTPWTGLRTRKARIIDGKPCYRVSDLIASFQVRYSGAIRTGKRNAMRRDSEVKLPDSDKLAKGYERMVERAKERAAANPIWGGMTDADKRAMRSRLARIKRAQAQVAVDFSKATDAPSRKTRKRA